MTEQEWLTSEDPIAMLEYLAYRALASRLEPYTMPMGRRYEPIISDRKLELFCVAGDCSQCKRMWRDSTWTTAAWKAHNCATADCGTPKERAVLLREIVGNPFRPGYRWTKKNHSWTSNLSGSGKPGRMYCYLPKDWLTSKVRDMAQTIYDGNDCGRCGGKSRGIASTKGGWATCPDCNGTGLVDCWEDMPILGDLLEESGCDNEEILRHCRQEERCVAKGPYHDGDYCNHGKVTAPNAQFTRQCEDCNGTGWIPKRTSCVRGCWVVDLFLGNN